MLNVTGAGSLARTVSILREPPMNTLTNYYVRKVAGSRAGLGLSIACQLGAFLLLVGGVGWRHAVEFGLFMVLLPSLYLCLIYSMSRKTAGQSAEANATSR
jgi:hypothetical protein